MNVRVDMARRETNHITFSYKPKTKNNNHCTPIDNLVRPNA